MKVDVAIIGGGPAGLASAIHAAARGLATALFERSATPPDKACGEGLMPEGVRALAQMGALDLISSSDRAPFIGVHYIQENGAGPRGYFRPGQGIGIRRTALVAAMSERARQVGAQLYFGSKAQVTRQRDHILIEHGGGTLTAQIVIAADGLASPLRRAFDLEGPARGARRFGMRRHYCLPAWSRFVEVYWRDGVEAYITPAGSNRVGVAFLWEDGHFHNVSFDYFLTLFPALAARIGEAAFDSEIRGAGPMLRAARARVGDRVALVGDAAGYIDAITGEGLSLAFTGAAALGEILPQALSAGATAAALAPYERACARNWRRYSLASRALLALSRRPRLRRAIFSLLSANSYLFDSLLNYVVGGTNDKEFHHRDTENS